MVGNGRDRAEIPALVENWIDGAPRPAEDGRTVESPDPDTGRTLCRLARSGSADVAAAVAGARRAQPGWAARTPVERGAILRAAARRMEDRREVLAATAAVETGKSFALADGEAGAAIEMGHFVAGEGRRSYGKTTTSADPGRIAMTTRQPLGVAGLIVPANTPIANIAWKVFPALLCGNAAVLKAAEDAPAIALAVARLLEEAGVPPGVLDVVQGLGPEAGAALVEHPGVDVVSFTGSVAAGRRVAAVAGERLAKGAGRPRRS